MISTLSGYGNFRAISGNYGAFFRNDGTYFYLLSTASGDQKGQWNTYRPLTFNMSTGYVSIDGTGSGIGFGSQIAGPQFLGTHQNMAMTQDNGATTGNFVCRAGPSTGEGNLAGMSFWHDSYGVKIGVRVDGPAGAPTGAYIGIGGWSAAPWKWYLQLNTGDMTASGNVSAYSDPRLKENFQRIVDPLSIINKLDGGTFNWKHGITHIECKAGKRDYGILADQVEAVMPEIVADSIEIEGETYKTVAYDKLVPVLIEAIKELTGKVATLEAQVADLKK
jgi:hypothetical protein